MAIAINTRYFDPIEYVKKLRNVGVSQEQAEVQAQELEQVIQVSVSQSRAEMDNKELATKCDIYALKLDIEIVKKEIEVVRKEIVQLNNKTLIWMFSMMSGFAVFMLGVMAKGFHWW